MNILEQAKSKMLVAIEHLKNDLKSLRTNRANAGMLDSIFVEIYGSSMRIKEVANVTAPEARTLLITPFDPSTTNAIGKSIEKANLGFMPIVDANSIRIKIPPMDENMRKEMVKQCHKKKEEAKISIRNIRREFNEAAKKQKIAGELTEDGLKRNEKNVQELTDKFCKEADELAEKKEKEIITI
ncbi:MULTISPECIES: ribosome recycling factor [unclassified Neochlamydia]|uniref:ribosome recycling factor n=1 Tax=unclassified Neochlamydia TaxID=2643326 RepID=UPI00140DC364|nr:MULTISPECIES: ribosome recycling factor [unclassified Neochlamydia]MBS4165213.1 Ribosome-recycling factor [Neochlamydia sp. AcF65]